MTASATTYLLRRRQVVEQLLDDRGDMLVIGGLGSTAWDITAAGDHDLSFPLWGAMGGTVAIGIGLATAQPNRRVLIITGDGDMLMGLGSLATAARQNLENLSVCVFDNEHYGETGMQATHTATTADLSVIATGCGFQNSCEVRSQNQLTDAVARLRRGPGLQFACIKVRAEKLDFVLPPKDGVFLKSRFRRALLGTDVV